MAFEFGEITIRMMVTDPRSIVTLSAWRKNGSGSMLGRGISLYCVLAWSGHCTRWMSAFKLF